VLANLDDMQDEHLKSAMQPSKNSEFDPRRAVENSHDRLQWTIDTIPWNQKVRNSFYMNLFV
jgi:hypothetical protein